MGHLDSPKEVGVWEGNVPPLAESSSVASYWGSLKPPKLHLRPHKSLSMGGDPGTIWLISPKLYRLETLNLQDQ